MLPGWRAQRCRLRIYKDYNETKNRKNINVKLGRHVQEKRVISSLWNVASPVVKVRSCLLFGLLTVKLNLAGGLLEVMDMMMKKRQVGTDLTFFFTFNFTRVHMRIR
ncbi:hypothetical protein CHL76_11870 [Marinococcus halophilus]|nr:hypothetical protein CHL76_11870 [Marinococcus halophilus]